MDLLAAVAAISVMATIVAVMFAFLGASVPSAAVRGRLEGLMAGTSVIEGQGGPAAALRQSGIGVGMLAGFTRGNLGERLSLQLERADLSLRPGEYVATRILMAMFAFAAPAVVLGGWKGLVLACVTGVIGYNVPKLYMNHKRNGRVARLNAQLPEALTIVANSLKAGFGLLQALDSAADQLAHPIATELRRTIHEMNIGSSAEEALVALSERSGSYDLDIVVTAILVQRTVGGNLGEILDTVAHTMRERIRIRGEIQTLTAQQKLTGFVIGGLPIVLGGLFQVMSPGYIAPLFTTFTGQAMLAAAVLMECVGLLVIQRILKIEV